MYLHLTLQFLPIGLVVWRISMLSTRTGARTNPAPNRQAPRAAKQTLHPRKVHCFPLVRHAGVPTTGGWREWKGMVWLEAYEEEEEEEQEEQEGAGREC